MRFLRLLLFTILGFVYPLSALEIYINRAFTTTEKAEATCYASGEGPLFLRVYRIDDVETYLTGQANAHTAEEKSERLMQPGYFLWRSVVDNFEYSLYQLARRYMRSDYRNLLRDYLGLQKYQFPFRDRFPETNLFAPLAYPVVFEKKIQVRAQYWHSLKQQFESLKAGYYLVEISQGRHIAHAPLVISDIAMVTKISPYNFLVYAVDLLKNKPLSNADLSVYSREKSGKIEKHILKENFKLKDGLLFSNDVGYLKNSQSTLYVLRQGSHYAFSDIYALDTTKSLYESAIYTERPVYRIGDIVQVRAVFVRKQGAAAHGKVKYSIKKGDEILYTSESPLTEAGSLAFTFKTDTLKPARYTILMEIQGEKHYGNFLIEQYKKPETRANIRVDKNILLNGETINADLTAQYFSGEPLSKASVEVTLERMRISFPWWYGFSGSEYYGDWNDYARWDFVKEYTAVLDAKGKLKIPVATSEKGIEAPTDSDYIYRVRAKVKAQNREETQASARFKVYRAPVQLRLTQNSWYFSAGAPITFNVNATSIYTDKPVSLRVQATLYQRTYDSKARRYNDNAVASQEILLPNSGYKEAEFTGIKKSGTYLVRVSATDAGRTTTDTLETYVYGEELFYTDNSAERNISISADKKEYNLFDTAAFAIQMPSEKKIPALVVIENDRIRKFKLFESVDASWIYKEELKNNLTPNFDISVLAFDYDKVPRFYSGQTQVVLPPQYRALTLEVTSDRERYRPGEEANFIVRTFDYQKKPVSAEFSLGVVDEAIYALHEDALKSLSLALNPRLTNSVVTANSLAFSFYGYGTEKSLYALYRNQMAEAAALKKGERERLKIRKNFKDTAFFMANGKTDASGLAKVHVPLPDNLTEWRITTHAHTRAGLSASGRTKITVSKDFALRLAKPRFLRERDEAQLRLLISNQLKEKQTAALEAQFENIKLVSKFPKTLDIPAGEEKYIDFKITNDTFPKEGKARLQFIARTQSDNDGLEMELPLLPYGVENFIASQKIFAPNEKTWQSTLQLPNGGRENLGTVNVSFTPGVLPSVHETLPYLIQYPYGCVEQTLSTFLPVLWASEASEKLKIPLPVKKQQFDAITEQGLRRLYGYQHGDGGWGWWSDDATDLYMTAYTLWGLHEAAQKGVAIDQEILNKGVTYLSKELLSQELRKAADSYAQHRLIFAQKVALALVANSKVKARIESDWKWYLEGGTREPAALALILEGSAKSSWKAISQSALEKLKALEIKSNVGSYFELTKKDNYYYWYNDREETTAQVLNALLTVDSKDNHALVERAVAYLIAQKKQQRWRSTKLSALIMRAFSTYAQQSGEKLLPVKVTATVNGVEHTREYNPKKSLAKDLLFTFNASGLNALINVSRSGRGFFLARAEWQHYLNAPLIKPKEGNFQLSRKYFSVNKDGNRYSKGKMQYNFKAGDLVMTEVNLNAAKGNEYLLLEDMIPAGFEPLTTTELLDLGDLRYDRYANSPSATERLDDRVGLAKTYLYESSFTPRAFYRAVFPGKYHAMPAQGGLMYYPETYAYSTVDTITIED